MAYWESESWRPTIDGLEFDCLDETERLSLERDFEEEILEALKRQREIRPLGLMGLLWHSSKNAGV